MSLFTAEGLLQGWKQAMRKGKDPDFPLAIYHAYLRWLKTQGRSSEIDIGKDFDSGWLISLPGLHQQRAPGITCLSALESGQRGTPQRPVNNSKGCGGVMRVAPVGLFINAYGFLLEAEVDSDHRAFSLGCELAALTHGHSSGWSSAGAFALLINRIVSGDSLPQSLVVCSALKDDPRYQEVLCALQKARALAEDP